MSDERTPLLRKDETSDNPDIQFCTLIGIPPSNLPPGAKLPRPGTSSLYARASEKRFTQNLTYIFTATLSNTRLLGQVILGATLTALGASGSSHILITIFGALNTVIAGIVAYLKSRGQPMRAKMFLNDLERVMDEIENSEVMWLGISKGVHGYDEITNDETVFVRSEVARLTRLYGHAVKSNTINDPDLYAGAGSSDKASGVKAEPSTFELKLPKCTRYPRRVLKLLCLQVQSQEFQTPTKVLSRRRNRRRSRSVHRLTHPHPRWETLIASSRMPTATSESQSNAASKDSSRASLGEARKTVTRTAAQPEQVKRLNKDYLSCYSRFPLV